MSNAELLPRVTDIPFGNEFSQFPEGSRVERELDRIRIYDATGTRRWEIHEYELGKENRHHRRLDLLGQTSGGTWHLLMGVNQEITDTREVVGIAVNIDVISGETDRTYTTTPKRNIVYRQVNGGVLYPGRQGGYSGERTGLESDLRRLHTLAVTADELPPVIDVKATADQLALTFFEGKFEPPEFILPAKELPGVHHQIPPQRFYEQLRERIRSSRRMIAKLD